MIHYGDIERTARTIRALRPKIGSNTLIVVNNTNDDIISLLEIIPGTKHIENRGNLGFARAVNKGIIEAQKLKNLQYILLLNNDIEFSFGSIDQLARTFLQRTSAGIVTPVLHHGKEYDWGGKISPWTGLVRHRNFEQKPKTVLTVMHTAAAAMMIRKEVIEKIGLFDERFFLYYEDADYCLRTHDAGFTVHINPEAVVEHVGSASTGRTERLIYNWISHVKFVAKYLFRGIYPTAFLADVFYYPLICLLSLVQ